MENFKEILEKAKFERVTDLSFGYVYETENIIVDFYQDEKGKNILEQFAKKIDGIWVTLIATDIQLQMMFKKLNETSLAYEEAEEFLDEPIYDLYDHYGVEPKNFY